jgi:hypothetical protein
MQSVFTLLIECAEGSAAIELNTMFSDFLFKAEFKKVTKTFVNSPFLKEGA